MNVTVMVISLLGQISPTKGSILKILSWNRKRSSSIALRIVLYFLARASYARFFFLSASYRGSFSSYDEESLISLSSTIFFSLLLNS
jgi:hypothetical protein